MDMEEGIVYVLKNPAFPNLVKIGITLRDEVQIRMSELYSTGVPRKIPRATLSEWRKTPISKFVNQFENGAEHPTVIKYL